MAYQFNYEIGTTYAGRVNVESLAAVPNMAPRSRPPFPYQEAVSMASGVAIGRGFPTVVWEWGFIYTDQFNSLRTICPGASAAVYIRTISTLPSTYTYYTARMNWPALDSYEPIAKGYQPFSLTFTHLVVYTP